jgi:signal peptidase II
MSRIYTLIISLGAFIIALDQWTKSWALGKLDNLGDTIEVFSWWSWTLVHNYGAAFGMLRNLPPSIRTVFFLVLPIAVLALLWFSYVRHFKTKDLLGPVAMGLILGGALGNLIDRIKYGYVVDFIDWHYPSTGECIPLFFKMSPDACHWPVFNIADSAICVAMVTLIIYSWRAEKASKK